MVQPAHDWMDDTTAIFDEVIEETERQQRNLDPARQHRHNWTGDEVAAYIQSRKYRDTAAIVFYRGGYASAALQALNIHVEWVPGPSWEDCTPAERIILFPWAACQAYQVSYNTPRFIDPNKRWPLLHRAVKWVAILSDGEATSCLREYTRGNDFAGEAVNHFGGATAVITRAWLVRHTVSNLAKLDS